MKQIVNHHKFLRKISPHIPYGKLKLDMPTMNDWVITGSAVEAMNIADTADDTPEIVYNLILTKISANSSSRYTYGVCVEQNGHMIDYVLGLSNDYEKVRDFVALCNQEELCLVHFHDVVEDFFDIRFK